MSLFSDSVDRDFCQVRVGGEGRGDGSVADGGGDPLVSSTIDGREVGEFDDRECLEVDAALGRAIGRLEAARLVVRARFARSRPAELDGGEQRFQSYDEFAADELAAALVLAPAEAEKQLAFAVGVARRMPVAVSALAAGVIDMARLLALERLTAPLDEEQVEEVVGPVLSEGGGRSSCRAFAAAVRRRIAVVDPQGAQRRRRKAVASRRVGLRAEADGLARMSALLPAEKAVGAFRRLDHLARKAVAPGDERDLDQRRADVFLDLLMGCDKERVRTELLVIVPVESLLGLSEKPGELPGFGPIPADVARRMSTEPGCALRRVLTDPVEGKVLEVSDKRLPSAALDRFVRVRNPECVFPGCPLPSTACDLDHTCARVDGGVTGEANLGPLCRHHHRLKHAPSSAPSDNGGDSVRGGRHWTLEQVRSGVFDWTSPTGIRRREYAATYSQ